MNALAELIEAAERYQAYHDEKFYTDADVKPTGLRPAIAKARAALSAARCAKCGGAGTVPCQGCDGKNSPTCAGCHGAGARACPACGNERQCRLAAIAILSECMGPAFNERSVVKAAEILSKRGAFAQSAVERITEVVGQDGKPVAAPCAISGCQYGALHSASVSIKAHEEALVELNLLRSQTRELAERCRPAVAHDARLRERDAHSDKYAHTYKPVLKAEAERAAKLLDDIDAILGARSVAPHRPGGPVADGTPKPEHASPDRSADAG